MELFKLVGSIFVDNTKANESIATTDKKANGVAKTLVSGAKTAAKWGSAIVGGAAVAGTAIYKVASDTATAVDAIDKMSQRLGISRKAYQELDFVLSQSGSDINSFQTGMKSLLAKMDAFTEGNKTAIGIFEKLGVSVVDASGNLRSQEDVLFDTISAFQGMEQSAEKSRLAQELFGKQGQDILPLLNAESGSLEEMRQKAEELGLVLGDDLIDSGVQLNDTFDQIKRGAKSILLEFGGSLLPLIQKVSDFVISNLPTVQSMISVLIPVVLQLGEGIIPPLLSLITSIFPILVDLINTLLPPVTMIIQALLPVIIQLLETLLPPILEIVQILLPPLLELLLPIFDLLGPIITLLEPIIQLILEIITPLTSLITSVLTPLISVVTKVINVAINPLTSALKLVGSVIGGYLTEAFKGIQGIIKNVQGVFTNLIGFFKNVFTGNWKAAWENIKNIFANIISGVAGIFKTPINAIINGINSFINGLNGIKIPDWVPVVGGKSFHINPIPLLAKGAVLERGQVGLLEGNGAEAVVPLHENRKWIHAVAQDMTYESGIGGGEKTVKLLAAILDVIEQLTGSGLYIDGKKLVGYLAPEMDKQLGKIQTKKARS